MDEYLQPSSDEITYACHSIKLIKETFDGIRCLLNDSLPFKTAFYAWPVTWRLLPNSFVTSVQHIEFNSNGFIICIWNSVHFPNHLTAQRACVITPEQCVTGRSMWWWYGWLNMPIAGVMLLLEYDVHCIWLDRYRYIMFCNSNNVSVSD